MVQHARHNQTRRFSWPTFLSGAIVGATLVVVVVQLSTAGRLAGSRPLRILGRRKLHQTVHHAEYLAALPELLEHSEPHYVAFTSGLNERGLPWCPDCAAAMPIIREVVLGSGGSLLEVSVGNRADWANKQHPVRVDAKCPVHFVPTLYYWTSDGCGSSIANLLNSDETEEGLRLLVAKFVQQTAAGKRYVDQVTRAIIESGGKGCGNC